MNVNVLAAFRRRFGSKHPRARDLALSLKSSFIIRLDPQPGMKQTRGRWFDDDVWAVALLILSSTIFDEERTQNQMNLSVVSWLQSLSHLIFHIVWCYILWIEVEERGLISSLLQHEMIEGQIIRVYCSNLSGKRRERDARARTAFRQIHIYYAWIYTPENIHWVSPSSLTSLKAKTIIVILLWKNHSRTNQPRVSMSPIRR